MELNALQSPAGNDVQQNSGRGWVRATQDFPGRLRRPAGHMAVASGRGAWLRSPAVRRALLFLIPLAACPPSDGADAGADAGQPCRTVSDCGQAGACDTVRCASGSCLRTFLPLGTPAGTQTVGDCKRVACDGQGAIT